MRFRLPDKHPKDAKDPARALADAVWTEFERVGRIFNAFDPTSELGRLNAQSRRSRGKPSATAVSAGLERVLDLSKTLFEASGGAFDPTIGPVRDLWRAAAETDGEPSVKEIDRVRKLVGLGRVRTVKAPDGNRMIILPPGGMQLDLGAIAKGYAVDRVGNLLKARGARSALVVLGGDVSAFGDNDGRPWRIGIQHPRRNLAVWGTVEVRGALRVSSSGSYRQPIVIDGRVHHHIFDPRTARPVTTRIEGVSTVDLKGQASNALLDGLATAITVLGPEAGLQLARALEVEALVLVAEGDAKQGSLREQMTEGFRAVYRRSTSSVFY